MKKILLLLVSGLLIACMAESVMASPANSTLLDANTHTDISGDLLNLSRSGVLSIHFAVPAYNSLESGTYTYSSAVTPWKNADGVILGSAADVVVDIPDPKTFYLQPVPAGTLGSFTDTKIITVTLKDTAPIGAVYHITIGDEGFILTSASTNISAVPEFPTVALPVAAILGLFFIFGRKKEGL